MKKTVFALAILASPAFAQQQPTAADRIAATIGALTIQMEQQRDEISRLQAELAKAQARIKETETPKSEKGK